MERDGETLLDIKDLMKTFNISRRTVYLWIDKGIFNPIKIEGTLRFHPKDIQDLIAKYRAVAGTAGKIKILAVDDDILVRESLKSLLSRQGYAVSVLAGGQEAVEHLTDSDAQYDLVIADLRMPGMHGIDMIRKLREVQEKKRRPPFGEMVITAYNDPEAKKEAKELGIRHFLIKPFDIDFFYKEIQKALPAVASLPI